jgi:chaperonin cofactor prefoldin
MTLDDILTEVGRLYLEKIDLEKTKTQLEKEVSDLEKQVNELHERLKLEAH